MSFDLSFMSIAQPRRLLINIIKTDDFTNSSSSSSSLSFNLKIKKLFNIIYSAEAALYSSFLSLAKIETFKKDIISPNLAINQLQNSCIYVNEENICFSNFKTDESFSPRRSSSRKSSSCFYSINFT